MNRRETAAIRTRKRAIRAHMKATGLTYMQAAADLDRIASDQAGQANETPTESQ